MMVVPCVMTCIGITSNLLTGFVFTSYLSDKHVALVFFDTSWTAFSYLYQFSSTWIMVGIFSLTCQLHVIAIRQYTHRFRVGCFRDNEAVDNHMALTSAIRDTSHIAQNYVTWLVGVAAVALLFSIGIFFWLPGNRSSHWRSFIFTAVFIVPALVATIRASSVYQENMVLFQAVLNMPTTEVMRLNSSRTEEARSRMAALMTYLGAWTQTGNTGFTLFTAAVTPVFILRAGYVIVSLIILLIRYTTV